jgi:hypothetical protein
MKTFEEFINENIVSEGVNFDEQQYIEDMGKPPSGKSTWIFYMMTGPNKFKEFEFTGDYKKAKIEAEKDAVKAKVSYIIVGEQL